VVLGVEALAAAVAVVEVVDLVVVFEVAAVVLVVLAVLASFALVAVLALFALAAIQPVISIMPATLAVPATRRARRAGWGRRRLRGAGALGVVFTFDSFGVPHCAASMESMIGAEPQSLLRTAWVVPPIQPRDLRPWVTPSDRDGRRGRPGWR
jgi:hypothetical protein